jgi:hypothetical protein
VRFDSRTARTAQSSALLLLLLLVVVAVAAVVVRLDCSSVYASTVNEISVGMENRRLDPALHRLAGQPLCTE